MALSPFLESLRIDGGWGVNHEDEEGAKLACVSTLPAVLKLECAPAAQGACYRNVVLGDGAVGGAALYFKQSSRGDSEAGDPADHTLRNWALGEESARNRCSVNM